MTTHHHTSSLLFCVPLALHLAAAALPAQAGPTSATTNAPIVELSPFTAVSENDTGYRAQNTLSGSRLNSSLKDTPGVLDVLTKDFLDDIGATTLREALAYSTNFADDLGDFDSQSVINTIFPGAQLNVNFRSRGLGGTMARLTANPIRGLRLRATYSKTARERENLFRFTLPMAAQLRAYITDLQARNPGVNVGNLASAANPTTGITSLLDQSAPIIRRTRTDIVAPGGTPPPAEPSSYFIRTPRAWTLSSKFDF